MMADSLDSPHKLRDSSTADVVDVDPTFSKLGALSASRSRLPDLSASTQEILARVQAESATNIAEEPPPSASNLNPSPTSIDNLVPLDSISNTTAQFQQPRMASGIFDKSKLKSAFASALIPKSKTLPSQPLKDFGTQTTAVAAISIGQDSSLPSEKSVQRFAEASSLDPLSRKSNESTIEVMSSPTKSAPPVPSSAEAAPDSKPNVNVVETLKPKMRMSHTYVLPSGEIVNSGKGLGRGRPGIKRGPRKPKSTPVPTPSETKPIMSRKRKRASGDSNVELAPRSRSRSRSASDSGDEIAPQATQTRSGRHTQRPTTFVPPESPSHKKTRRSESSSINAGKPPVKRKGYKGKEQSALCEHCLRGYGPLKNAIVFCDGCNKCWHQRCHEPMIPRKLVLDPNSEWFCNDCTAHKDKAKEAQRGQNTDDSFTAAEKEVAPSRSSVDTARKDYFNTLPKETLVDLLMQASALAPDLRLWQSPPSSTPPQPTTGPTPDPAPSTKEDAYPTPKNEPSEAEDDYDEYEDEHAKLYPRPGKGIQLPPESEDLHMLLEDPDSRTFSHSLRAGLVAAGAVDGT